MVVADRDRDFVDSVTARVVERRPPRTLLGSAIELLGEPRNHLDREGVAWLARHLKNRWSAGDGGLLVITHDRWFLDEVSTSTHLLHLPGGVQEYLQWGQQMEQGGLGPAEPTSAGGGVGEGAIPPGLTGAERHALQKELSSIERKLDRIAGEVARLHEFLAAHDQSDFQGLQELTTKLSELESENDALEERWLELSAEIE